LLSFFFQAEDGIRDFHVTGVQTCALPISGVCVECSQAAVHTAPVSHRRRTIAFTGLARSRNHDCHTLEAIYAMHAKPNTAALTPLALKDAPALIETVFPAQQVSFEAQKERKANLGHTLTGLGSYWQGRKPPLQGRARALGTLLPATDDAESDLPIFEKLMAFDDEGLARRALAANAFSATKLQELIAISDPERYFSGRGWRRDITTDDKLVLYRKALATMSSYEEKA